MGPPRARCLRADPRPPAALVASTLIFRFAPGVKSPAAVVSVTETVPAVTVCSVMALGVLKSAAVVYCSR